MGRNNNTGTGTGTDGPQVIAKYNPADFVIAAQDHQGHSERLWCRVQPMHDRQVDIVVRSKKFPFRTKGDIIRWCIVRGLKVLEVMEPDVRGFMQQADAINEILRDEMYMQEFMGLFEQLHKTVMTHISMNAQGEAIRLVAQVKAKIDLIEGEPHWKRKCQDILAERFGHLLNQKPVGLHRLTSEED